MSIKILAKTIIVISCLSGSCFLQASSNGNVSNGLNPITIDDTKGATILAGKGCCEVGESGGYCSKIKSNDKAKCDGKREGKDKGKCEGKGKGKYEGKYEGKHEGKLCGTSDLSNYMNKEKGGNKRDGKCCDCSSDKKCTDKVSSGGKKPCNDDKH